MVIHPYACTRNVGRIGPGDSHACLDEDYGRSVPYLPHHTGYSAVLTLSSTCYFVPTGPILDAKGIERRILYDIDMGAGTWGPASYHMISALKRVASRLRNGEAYIGTLALDV